MGIKIKLCDTLSNDTSSNEPFRLKVTSLKWHFVNRTHCRKMVSSNSFDEKISWLFAIKPVAMLLCWLCAHHMTTDNVGSLNHDNLIYPVWRFYNILELNFHPFFIDTFTTHTTQISKIFYLFERFCLLYSIKRKNNFYSIFNKVTAIRNVSLTELFEFKRVFPTIISIQYSLK